MAVIKTSVKSLHPILPKEIQERAADTRDGGTGRPARSGRTNRAFSATRQAVWFEAQNISS